MSNTSSPLHGSSEDSSYQEKQIQPQFSTQQPGNHGNSADSPHQGKQVHPQFSAQQPGSPIPHGYGAFMLLPIMQPSGFTPNTTGSLLPNPPCLSPAPPNTTGAPDKLLHSRDEENTHPSTKKAKPTTRAPDSGNKLWQSYHDDKLIPYLAEQVKKGMKNGKSFKKPVFMEAANLINTEFRTNFSPENVENHMKALRTRYTNMTKCKKLSGHGWNAETSTANMDPQTYRAFELANPKLKDFVNKPLKWFDELGSIVGDDFAAGSFCRSVFEEVPGETPAEVTHVVSQRRSRKRASKQEDEYEGLIKACDRVMVAIEKASIGWGAQLEAKVREFGCKYPESFLDMAIETLFENERVGKVFILKSKGGRESWLDSYAVQCGVVDGEAGGSRRGDIDGEE